MVSTYVKVNRSAKAAEIAAQPETIKRNGSGWYVHSQTANVWYWTDGNRCTCPDWEKRQPAGGCKHMQALALHLAALTSYPVCGHCGHQGPDVVSKMQYVGGHGYQQHTRCKNEVECWQRWDRAHGLA